MPLNVQLNGQKRTFESLAPGSSLQDLIEVLDLKADRIAVERNGEIVPREARPAAVLGESDKVEIVHFVGGGRR